MFVSLRDGTLSRAEVVHWCKEYHYAHRVPSISHAFGWVENGELHAVLTIGKPASPFLCRGIAGNENASKVFELNRICAKESLSIPLSQFVSMCLKNLPDDLIIVSYADRGQNHNGTIYQATNFLYTGATKERTDIACDGHSRHYEKADSYPNRVHRSSKHRYVTFTGKKLKKLGPNILNYPISPYPKETSQRYDIDWSR